MHGIKKMLTAALKQTFLQHVFFHVFCRVISQAVSSLWGWNCLNNSTPCAFTSNAMEDFYYKQEGCICSSMPHNPSGLSIEPYTKRHHLVYKVSVREYKTLTSPPAHTIKTAMFSIQPLIDADFFEPPLRPSKCAFDVFILAGFISDSLSMPRTEGFPEVCLQIQLFWGSNEEEGKHKICWEQSVIITLKIVSFHCKCLIDGYSFNHAIKVPICAESALNC